MKDHFAGRDLEDFVQISYKKIKLLFTQTAHQKVKSWQRKQSHTITGPFSTHDKEKN